MPEIKTARWMQRLDTYQKALSRLKELFDLSRERALCGIEIDALIQRFEFTYEMAWKLMMSYEKENGLEQIRGSRDIIREAYRFGLIENVDVWFNMVDTRNKTVHNYDEEMALNAVDVILYDYYPLLEDLRAKCEEVKQEVLQKA